MPAVPSVDLVPAAREDYPLIEAWLRRAEIQRWWGSFPAAQAAVIAALQAPTGLCSIVRVDGVAAGYVQAEEAGPGEPGAYRLDAFIGEPRFRGIGAGRLALELAAAEVFQTTLAVALVAIVPLRNEAAVRLYERAGFAWVRVIEDPLLGACWLMKRARE